MRPLRPLALAAASLVLLSAGAAGQAPERPPAQLDAASILHRMRALGVVRSVLYLAAHPDDENTRLISSFSNGTRARTAYLSLTRGDGGQNLVGGELGPALGVLRTQELVEARRIDGGEQFFTRAVDFGYSKSPDETFALWGRAEVLADVVRVVRTFRPDLIVTRFAPDGSGGHGQHTASARLARAAFDAAADANAFPEQLAEGLEPWHTERLFFNASTWWNRDLPEQVADEPGGWAVVDVGGYEPLLGTSLTELAGQSRSQHKSQGFGASQPRGSQLEYLRLDAGRTLASTDPFDGLDLGWERFEGGASIARLVSHLVEHFEPDAPERSARDLVALIRALEDCERGGGPAAPWARHHVRAARELLLQLFGAAVEVTTARPSAARGETVEVTLEAIQRRPGATLTLEGLLPIHGAGSGDFLREELGVNRPSTRTFELPIGDEHPIDEPYWLALPHGTLYAAARGHQGIEPTSRPGTVFQVQLLLTHGTELLPFSVERPLMHTWVERVAGQRTRRFVVTPSASLRPLETVAIVQGETTELTVEVEALGAGVGGTLRATLPEGWTLVEEPAPVEPLDRGERSLRSLVLRRGPDAVPGDLHLALVSADGAPLATRTRHAIDYPHILPQVWYEPATVRLVPLDVRVSARRVGYVDGAGDAVPEALERLGVSVETIDPESALAADLDRFDAIVTGVRAYNAVAPLARLHPLLLDWVQRGGTLVVQYNTASRDMVVDPRSIGPRPFALTRRRVTDETARPTFLLPDHPLLSTPNRLGPADFEGWVQERGLYFAGDLDPAYAAPIAWNDTGEAPLEGSLIACDHGDGRFVYTGISLFRQLPAGVPGAYRLLANLLARRSAGE